MRLGTRFFHLYGTDSEPWDGSGAVDYGALFVLRIGMSSVGAETGTTQEKLEKRGGKKSHV